MHRKNAKNTCQTKVHIVRDDKQENYRLNLPENAHEIAFYSTSVKKNIECPNKSFTEN